MKTYNQKSLISYFTFFIFIFSLSGTANANKWGQDSYYNSSVRIDVVDDRGHYLRKFPTNSRNPITRREYLEAKKGKRYQLRIRNMSNRRIGVVIAVDGRNILSGKKSYLRNNEKMYVLNPYETANYKGWRTGKNRINRFYFTSAGDSYSNAWGDRSAMGVIAVAVYDEKQKRRPPRYNNFNYKSNGLSRRAAPSSRRYNESTGTGFGREEYSPSINVQFVANSRPSHKYFYKYEWRRTLCKRRIIRCNNNQHRNKNRFWPESNNGGYVPYPPSYNIKENGDFNVLW